MRFLLLILLTGLGLTSYQQNNFTIGYNTIYNEAYTLLLRPATAAFKLVIQDTLAFCYYFNSMKIKRKKVPMPVPLGSGYWPKSIFFDRPKCSLMYYIGHYDRPATQVLQKEKCSNDKWTIYENETKMILGLKCIKAEGEYNGRNYIAWFTKSLPAGFGPFCLTSLPGTILEKIHIETGLRSRAVYVYNDGPLIVEPGLKKQ